MCPSVCATVCTLESQKHAKFREALIDVTITAIYPDARLFLCDTRTSTRKSSCGRMRGRRERWDDGDCWMRPSKWVPATVAVQQWQNINLNPNCHPSCSLIPAPAAPLSSSLVYSMYLRPTTTTTTMLRCPLGRYAVFILAREFLLRHSALGLHRVSLPLYAVLVPSLCLPL